jgi:hypothetical protein
LAAVKVELRTDVVNVNCPTTTSCTEGAPALPGTSSPTKAAEVIENLASCNEVVAGFDLE